MKYFNKIYLAVAFIVTCNTSICQWSTKSITLPLVRAINGNLSGILDTIFNAEKKCDYYNDSLLLGLSIRTNSEDIESFSIQFETQNSKEVMLELEPLAYFKHNKHLCLIYYSLPALLFIKTDNSEVFFYNYYDETKINGKDTSKIITIYHMEDDSFSQWVYYYSKSKFHFYNHYSYCN